MRCYNILLRSFRLLAAKRRFHLTHAIVMSIMLFAPVGIYADDIPVDEAHFPDANFRAFVKANTANGDDVLTEAEAAKITTFGNGLKGLGITDLTGLKYFTKLQKLYCQDNRGITSIDLSGNPELRELNITGCKVTSLDFSHNPNMTNINCADMKTLTDINVSACTNLQYLFVGNNPLTSLDVTKNTKLKQLSIHKTKITSIDISKNTALSKLYAFGNPQLTNLDWTHNTGLVYLSVYDNQWPTLDVSMLKYLQTLLCFDNKLTTLDLSNNKALTGLSCYSCSLTTLNLSSNTALKYLDCRKNRISSLILPTNASTIMTFISVAENALSSIDLSNYKLNATPDQSFRYPNVSAQKSDMKLYTDGTDAYMLVQQGIDVSKISDAKINIDNSATPVTFSVGDAVDGMVKLKFPNGSVRKRLFNYYPKASEASKKFGPITITYNYNTGTNFKYEITNSDKTTTTYDLSVMDVTDTIECYLLPMSQEYGSVCLPYDALLPEGATAYAVSATNVKAGSDNNTATLTPIATAGEVVAANTPMLIHRSSDSYSLFAFNRGTGTAKAADTNLLLGTKNTSIDNSDTYYVLGVNSTTGSKHYKQLGFWRSTNKKIGTWRAYLDLTASSASAARGFVFALDDSPTSISRVRTTESAADALWYTIDGTVLPQKPTEKGIYIHGGRKISVTH